jgi:hypothetical protein
MWMQYGPWLSQPREIQIFSRPRILIREITGKLPHCIHAAFATGALLNNKSVLNVLHERDNLEALKCLLGVLNSTPFSMYYKARAVKGARTLFPKLVINNLRELPFPKLIGPRDRKDLVGLVDRMTSLQEELRSAKSEHQRAVTNRMVSEVDGKIDALVTRRQSLRLRRPQQKVTLSIVGGFNGAPPDDGPRGRAAGGSTCISAGRLSHQVTTGGHFDLIHYLACRPSSV